MMYGGDRGRGMGGMGYGGGGMPRGGAASAGRGGMGAGVGNGNGGAATDSLFVRVNEAIHPINENVLSKVFEPIAPPVSVQMLPAPAPNTAAAIVRFANPGIALQAKNARSGREIYGGCCQMQISFTTPPAQPSVMGVGPGGLGGLLGGPSGDSHFHHHHHHHHHHVSAPTYGAPASVYGGGGHHHHHAAAPYGVPAGFGAPPRPPMHHHHHHHGGATAVPGFIPRGRGGAFGGHHHHHQHHSVMAGAGAPVPYGAAPPPVYGGLPPQQHLHHHHHHHAGNNGGYMAPQMPYMPHHHHHMMMHHHQQQQPSQMQIQNSGPIVPNPFVSVAMVSETASLQALFNVIENWGAVHVARRNFQKPEIVCVKMSSNAEAQAVSMNLKMLPFFGKHISGRTFNNYTERHTEEPPEEGDPSNPAVKSFNFTNRSHRTTSWRAKGGPSHVVAVGNISSDIEVLRAYLQGLGVPVQSIVRNEAQGYFVVTCNDIAGATMIVALATGAACGESTACTKYLSQEDGSAGPVAAGAATSAAMTTTHSVPLGFSIAGQQQPQPQPQQQQQQQLEQQNNNTTISNEGGEQVQNQQ